MKPKIHPKFVEATISCACGNSFETISNQAQIKTEICSNCHPFYTGKQKFVDIAGRVDRFNKKVATVKKKKEERDANKKKKIKKVAPKTPEVKNKEAENKEAENIELENKESVEKEAEE
ncbi:50S ribosomal protein L31 [Candidatus Riflebacteria bacterium]